MNNVPDVATQQEVYQQTLETNLFFSSFLSNDDSHPPADKLSADKDIQACFEEIRTLKSQLTPLEAYSKFIARILTENPIDKLATPKEAAIADTALCKEKQTLRAIKKERADMDANLPAIVEQVVASSRKRDAQSSRLERQLRASKAAMHAGEVNSAIKSQNITALERLIDVIDEVDEEHCEKIIALMQNLKAEDEYIASQRYATVDSLRNQVSERKTTLDLLQRKAADLDIHIEQINRTVPGASECRNECELSQMLMNCIFALGGVRVKQMREDGMKIAIDATIFGSSDMKHRWGTEHIRVTHVLDIKIDPMEVDDGSGCDLYVQDVTLDPPDVAVSDLKYAPLTWAVREVNSRLRNFIRSNKQ